MRGLKSIRSATRSCSFLCDMVVVEPWSLVDHYVDSGNFVHFVQFAVYHTADLDDALESSLLFSMVAFVKGHKSGVKPHRLVAGI